MLTSCIIFDFLCQNQSFKSSLIKCKTRNNNVNIDFGAKYDMPDIFLSWKFFSYK